MKPVLCTQIICGDVKIKIATVDDPPTSLQKKREKNLCRGLEPPKKSCRGSGHEKKFLLAGKVPPPTHHFSNGKVMGGGWDFSPITFLMVRPYTLAMASLSDWLKNLTPAFQPMRSKATS